MRSKELKRIIALAIRQGYSVELRNNGHYKFTAPTGRFIFTSGTPSDRRAIKNILADLKKLGLDTNEMP